MYQIKVFDDDGKEVYTHLATERRILLSADWGSIGRAVSEAVKTHIESKRVKVEEVGRFMEFWDKNTHLDYGHARTVFKAREAAKETEVNPGLPVKQGKYRTEEDL